MMLLVVVGFGCGIGLLLMTSVYFYGQMTAAKNSAIILARVMPGQVGADELYTASIPPERLAASPRWQGYLRDAPFVAQMATLLDQAGVPTTVAALIARVAGCSLGLGVVSYNLGCNAPAAIFAAMCSSVLPFSYYSYLRGKRVAAFEAQMPQVLEMLSLYLRSGRSLPQAFVAMAEEADEPARSELALCAEEYRLGRPLGQALRGLASKYPDLLGLKLFSIAVSVLGQTGGNLVEVLERIRRTLESSLTYVLKLRSLTGEARNSARLLGATPGVSLLASAVLNPGYFNQFFETTTGLCLLGLFCTLWLTGVVWIRTLMANRA
jgi:tight adherence protein B